MTAFKQELPGHFVVIAHHSDQILLLRVTQLHPLERLDAFDLFFCQLIAELYMLNINL